MWDDVNTSVSELKKRLKVFNQEREWEQFHTPKDLAMCIAAEAGELLECFLWKGDEASLDRDAIIEEIADLMITTANLAARLDIDMMAAVDRKLELNAARYPVSKARGRATKHTKL